ncbi:MAG: RpiB/LacA/LacB family sugar-phosphate isomerase, partial [Deltaproteobacteria bacterium]|nr:RpiB/LacA/LacB family sugar-phosphate isomerase [Deltaproteobacteria bacterium]
MAQRKTDSHPAPGKPVLLIASDHGGFELKEKLKAALQPDYHLIDLGTDSPASVDYPGYAYRLAEMISNGNYQRGILICGTGIGMSIAANRYPRVRAA